MKSIYENTYDFLKNGESVVLASVIANSGSTPREAGAKMIVRKSREIVGTIGGGKIEAEVQKLAAGLFDKKISSISHFDLTADGIASIGMICGGQASVYLQYLDAGDEKIMMAYEKLVQVIKENTGAWLITAILENGNDFAHYIYGSNSDHNDLLNPEILNVLEGNLKNKRISINQDNRRYVIEPIARKNKTFIFGGGHIGYELVPVLKRLGFHIVLVEDREEFANEKRFPLADEIVLDEYETSFEKLSIDNDSYIIIVTRGHLHDESVLVKALGTDAAYIGMIGSRKKWGAINDRLLAQGFTSQDIARVFAPIGLEIFAETPEEIAISIAAEIIKVKYEQNGK